MNLFDDKLADLLLVGLLVIAIFFFGFIIGHHIAFNQPDNMKCFMMYGK